ncbi:MAG: hypothetical protein QNJ78_02625 [Gammaproteobacteria bacterium]|nr:hypothetical protein [Gammaproteobacteria bacterium]
MVTPVNTDKSMAPGSERAAQSRQGSANEITEDRRADAQPQEMVNQASRANVDSALQMYRLENNRLGTLNAALETPEQAKALLNQIRQQMAEMPVAALQVQAGKDTAVLGNLLLSAPG